ncbi:MAG: hypothetical protein WDZ82_00830 [Candidatus Paceibacterota bacterium]
MWDVIKKNKYSVGLLALAVIAVIVYSVFYMTDGVSLGGDNQQETVSVSSERVGEDIFRLIEQLERIDLNPAIFDRPEFATLSGFDYVIRPRSEGRSDPFAPIGGASGDRGLTRQTSE